MGSAQSFEVKAVRTAPNGVDYAEVAAYQKESAGFLKEIVRAAEELEKESNDGLMLSVVKQGPPTRRETLGLSVLPKTSRWRCGWAILTIVP